MSAYSLPPHYQDVRTSYGESTGTPPLACRCRPHVYGLPLLRIVDRRRSEPQQYPRMCRRTDSGIGTSCTEPENGVELPKHKVGGDSQQSPKPISHPHPRELTESQRRNPSALAPDYFAERLDLLSELFCVVEAAIQ